MDATKRDKIEVVLSESEARDMRYGGVYTAIVDGIEVEVSVKEDEIILE